MTLFFQQLGVWEAPAKVTPDRRVTSQLRAEAERGDRRASPSPEDHRTRRRGNGSAGTSQRLFAETLTSRSI
jgi:hypothetical protein